MRREEDFDFAKRPAVKADTNFTSVITTTKIKAIHTATLLKYRPHILALDNIFVKNVKSDVQEFDRLCPLSLVQMECCCVRKERG